MNKSILVIAGAGFLGKNLLSSLKLLNPKNLGCIDIVNPGIESVIYYNVDLLNVEFSQLCKIIDSYDIIINCSGQITNPIDICLKLNTEAINKIINAIKNKQKLLYQYSTVTVYGTTEYAVESTSCNPETPYSSAKYFSEYLITSQLDIKQYCIIRLSNLYGDNQPKGVINYLISSFKSDKILDFNNDGNMIRYYLNVKDCVTISCNLIKNYNYGIYNLIGPEKYTLKSLIQLAEKTFNCKFQVSFNKTIAWDNTKLISDSRIRDVLKIEYKHTITKLLNNKINKD
jgi:nucleoside-diphosphate-sugar epimerase